MRPFFTTAPQVNVDRGRAPMRIGGEDPGHLAALAEQVALELAGDVEHAAAALVAAHVERIALDPDVVHPAVGRLVPGHDLRLLDVGDVDHLQPAPGQIVAVLQAGVASREA